MTGTLLNYFSNQFQPSIKYSEPFVRFLSPLGTIINNVLFDLVNTCEMLTIIVDYIASV